LSQLVISDELTVWRVDRYPCPRYRDTR